jgi:carbohydrate-binding DOMON domain-containing protein
MNMQSTSRLMALFALVGLPAYARADGPIKTDKNAGFTMSDPTGDDDGPGTYKYPTD